MMTQLASPSNFSLEMKRYLKLWRKMSLQMRGSGRVHNTAGTVSKSVDSRPESKNNGLGGRTTLHWMVSVFIVAPNPPDHLKNLQIFKISISSLLPTFFFIHIAPPGLWVTLYLFCKHRRFMHKKIWVGFPSTPTKKKWMKLLVGGIHMTCKGSCRLLLITVSTFVNC